MTELCPVFGPFNWVFFCCGFVVIFFCNCFKNDWEMFWFICIFIYLKKDKTACKVHEQNPLPPSGAVFWSQASLRGKTGSKVLWEGKSGQRKHHPTGCQIRQVTVTIDNPSLLWIKLSFHPKTFKWLIPQVTGFIPQTTLIIIIWHLEIWIMTTSSHFLAARTHKFTWA